MNLENVFSGTAQAQQTSGQKAAPGGALGMFMPMILVFGIFYLLLIRPQQKQKKQHQILLGNLKRGDEVVTTSGIHGKIHAVTDGVVTLEIADNLRIKMDKQHVGLVKQAPAA